MSALLSIHGLRKSFGALQVTDGIDLDIEMGEVHAIIGPNGAGKTTFVSQLSGQLMPDAGKVIFDGRDITRLDMAGRARLGISRSFQITRVLEGFSVLENVALAVQARSGSSLRFFADAACERELNAVALECLVRVGLDHRAQERASHLSHGEHRQLEFAIALASQPRLLLLDEPFAGSGREEADILLSLMRRLKGQQTILLIEHDMQAVFSLADRVSVLVYGALIATGRPDEIRADPQVRSAYLGAEETGGAVGC
ncbi:ABC transporter ATP-binding protein [Microbaculum marinisediminis]|uniref:ABC transporter ATP-binding protein n=1 Tax=Microbaculum marinisediminis TaxID=2931392 RepID=A0AAW5QVB7_9HYPH|nr:ABC transporter ATP-binding protein [Microbaculum sp. A6E488]MCT8971837.1 ABC transporter ATP-binding protein [Microbaculum sp. A6E488]